MLDIVEYCQFAICKYLIGNQIRYFFDPIKVILCKKLQNISCVHMQY